MAAVVRGGQLAQGPEVEAFEREVARRLGVAAGVALSSGSAALELGLRALGAGAGHEVIIPTYACDALHHAVTRCGATPVLADADPATHSLSLADARRRLTARTRAVILPHAFGLAADVARFAALGVPVVEDCAQALGATVDGRPVGSAGRLAVASFYATKLLTTGEGGLLGGTPELLAAARDARDYDERADLVPRFNYKMTEMQAALGRSQLRRLDAFIIRRRAIAARYRVALGAAACRLPPDVGEQHVYLRFVIAVERPLEPLIAALAALGVIARRPVHRPMHRALGLEGFPEAERLWRECLSLPCYPALTDTEVEHVAAAAAEVLGG